jgi:hypothetical protein
MENYIKNYAKSIPRTIVKKIMHYHPYIPIPQNFSSLKFREVFCVRDLVLYQH